MNPLFETDKYKKAELRMYNNLSMLSDATGIPRKMLKLAKKKDIRGFFTNGSINWTVLKPELERVYDTLVATEIDDIAYWKKEIAKRDVELKDLQIDQIKNDTIEPDDVRRLFVEISTQQSIVLNKVFKELPPKLAGAGETEIKVILDDELQTIYKVIKERIAKI
jgi:hypothetical protein